jgi:hypothetical protein
VAERACASPGSPTCRSPARRAPPPRGARTACGARARWWGSGLPWPGGRRFHRRFCGFIAACASAPARMRLRSSAVRSGIAAAFLQPFPPQGAAAARARLGASVQRPRGPPSRAIHRAGQQAQRAADAPGLHHGVHQPLRADDGVDRARGDAARAADAARLVNERRFFALHGPARLVRATSTHSATRRGPRYTSPE